MRKRLYTRNVGVLLTEDSYQQLVSITDNWKSRYQVIFVIWLKMKSKKRRTSKMNNLENANNYDVYEMIRTIAEDENLKRFLEEYKIAKISEINFKKYYQQR